MRRLNVSVATPASGGLWPVYDLLLGWIASIVVMTAPELSWSTRVSNQAASAGLWLN
jgi:hypothetical protein